MVFKDTQTKLENPQTNSLQPKKQHSPPTSNPHILYDWQAMVNKKHPIQHCNCFQLDSRKHHIWGDDTDFSHLNLYENRPVNTEDISERALKREKYVASKLYVL